MTALRELLQDSIDYAGLFPPAGLDLAASAHNYAAYRRGAHSWALGRFILPLSRLKEFELAADPFLSRQPAAEPWRLGALAGGSAREDIAALGEFNCRHAAAGATAVSADVVELKADSVAAIGHALERLPSYLQAYVEIPIDADPAPLVDAIARHGARAKVRTGGVTREAFPTPAELLRFLRACARAGVAFKATAGLHHPLRGDYRLTYAPDSPIGTMFGFLNVFLATAFLRQGMGDDDVARLLEEESIGTFHFSADAIGWRGYRLGLEAIHAARREGIVSFGSCSFTEPVADLTVLGLL